MDDSDKIKMNLNIGEQRISLSVPFDRQEFVRDVESEADGLYKKWRKAFPARTDSEILAMVAYQYASFYAELRQRYNEASSRASECLGLLSQQSAGDLPDDIPEE